MLPENGCFGLSEEQVTKLISAAQKLVEEDAALMSLLAAKNALDQFCIRLRRASIADEINGVRRAIPLMSSVSRVLLS